MYRIFRLLFSHSKGENIFELLPQEMIPHNLKEGSHDFARDHTELFKDVITAPTRYLQII